MQSKKQRHGTDRVGQERLNNHKENSDNSIKSQDVIKNISDAAYFMYVAGGRINGQDKENWLKAEQTINIDFSDKN